MGSLDSLTGFATHTKCDRFTKMWVSVHFFLYLYHEQGNNKSPYTWSSAESLQLITHSMYDSYTVLKHLHTATQA